MGCFPSQFGAWTPGTPELAIKSYSAVSSVVDALSPKERRSYSIVSAIRAMSGGHGGELEREISAAIAGKLGREPDAGGLFVPSRMNPQASGLDTLSSGTAKYAVMTEVRDMIDLLRNKTLVIRLGATLFSGLTSNVQFPRQLTGSTGTWVTENPPPDVPQTDATFGYMTLSPKTFMATTSYSKQLLQQSSIDVENFVRNDLATAHGLGIDLAALDGTGEDNQPLGLLRTEGVGAVTMGASGGAPTYDKVLELETNIADSNADAGGMKFMTTPQMRAKLRKLTATEFSAQPIWGNSGTPGVGDLCGYPAYVSNQVPQDRPTTDLSHSDCHSLILGYWPSLIIGEFGLMSITVDPYSLKKKAMVEATSFQMVDIGIRQPAAFSAVQDLRNV